MFGKSIFLDNKYPHVTTTRDKIAALWVEMDACERLLKMGYKSSNGVSLEKRANELGAEIARLEREKRNRLDEALMPFDPLTMAVMGMFIKP